MEVAASEAVAARESKAEATPSPTRVRTSSRRRRLILLAAIVLVGAGVGTWQVLAHRGLQSTDNAQIEAEIVAVPTRVGGVVARLLFDENQRVEAGATLAILDDGPARARLAEAQAALDAAEARALAADADVTVATTQASGESEVASAGKQTAESAASAARVQLREGEAAVRSAQAAYAQARADEERDAALLRGGALARSAYDATATAATVAKANLDAARARLASLHAGVTQARSRIGEAEARVEQTRDVDSLVTQARSRAKAAHAQVEVARAAVDLARLELSYTTISAPQAGVLSKKSVAVGEMLAPGQAIAQLVTDDRWVTANFKETQIADMRVGQPADVDVDAFPDTPLHGHVGSFAGGTGAEFTLLPPDNASGNFTKVVQRVPVRVLLDAVPATIALRAGLSADVVVDTRGAAALGR
ncbi:MAG: HlyD family secretion protein [Deltaproteobacteria bacterium]|nr:HlyD family secretion protein [Deltaproteobacteria bacterium]MCB9789080.1 HlyD family secretion protein [Deltaproteobacteria bacterium]